MSNPYESPRLTSTPRRTTSHRKDVWIRRAALVNFFCRAGVAILVTPVGALLFTLGIGNLPMTAIASAAMIVSGAGAFIGGIASAYGRIEGFCIAAVLAALAIAWTGISWIRLASSDVPRRPNQYVSEEAIAVGAAIVIGFAILVLFLAIVGALTVRAAKQAATISRRTPPRSDSDR